MGQGPRASLISLSSQTSGKGHGINANCAGCQESTLLLFSTDPRHRRIRPRGSLGWEVGKGIEAAVDSRLAEAIINGGRFGGLFALPLRLLIARYLPLLPSCRSFLLSVFGSWFLVERRRPIHLTPLLFTPCSRKHTMVSLRLHLQRSSDVCSQLQFQSTLDDIPLR
jgi:hypothetical protein